MLHVGKVTRVDSRGRLWVEVPTIMKGLELGPMATIQPLSGSTITYDSSVVGERVVVEQIEYVGNFVVLGRLVD